jgi:transposase
VCRTSGGHTRSDAGGGRRPAPGTACRNRKKSAREGRTVFWVDEADFYLLRTRVRTHAPRGRTPIVTVALTRDHGSVIGALVSASHVPRQVRTQALCGVDAVGFLRHLLRHVAGPLLVTWDGAPIHRGRAVTEFLTSTPAPRVWLERLPGYAPNVNPVVGIRRNLKLRELGAVYSYDQQEPDAHARCKCGRPTTATIAPSERQRGESGGRRAISRRAPCSEERPISRATSNPHSGLSYKERRRVDRGRPATVGPGRAAGRRSPRERSSSRSGADRLSPQP